MAKKPAKNVEKLIAAQTPKPPKEPKVSLPGRFKRKPIKPKPKKPPKNVITLIEKALKRQGKL